MFVKDKRDDIVNLISAIEMMQVIVTINYSVIFFISKADRIASSGQVSGSRKAALGNLVLAVVIDYRMRDSLPISICAAGHKYIVREKL